MTWLWLSLGVLAVLFFLLPTVLVCAAVFGVRLRPRRPKSHVHEFAGIAIESDAYGHRIVKIDRTWLWFD